MKRFESIKQQWQTAILGYRFIQLVKAPYGDSAGIGRLARTVYDPESIEGWQARQGTQGGTP